MGSDCISSWSLLIFSLFKPLRSLITPSLETAISFMKGADLSRSGTWVCSFLLNTSVNWPLNSSAFSRSDWATPFPFFLFRGGIPWVSFFWLGFALTSPAKLFTYKSCCFLTSALISLLKVSNFDLSLLLPVFFAFAWVLFFLRIFLLISGVIQGIEETDLLVFDGICLSAESWIKEVNKSKFSCTERVSEWPLKYFSFANSIVSFLIDSKSPFW